MLALFYGIMDYSTTFEMCSQQHNALDDFFIKTRNCFIVATSV